jgi:hypothetical protein
MTIERHQAPGPTDWVREPARSFVASAGAKAANFYGIPIVPLTTVGATSGKLRTGPPIRIEHKTQGANVAFNRESTIRSAWYGNAVHNLRVTPQDGDQRRGHQGCQIRVQEYRQWRERAVANHFGVTGYIEAADRTIPVFGQTGIQDPA